MCSLTYFLCGIPSKTKHHPIPGAISTRNSPSTSQLEGAHMEIIEHSPIPSMENTTENRGNMISLLNLPESILDCILQRLSPIELRKMSEVCTSLRDACRSDHLWENVFNQKWGRLIGDAALKEWQWHLVKSKSTEEETLFDQNGSLGTSCGSGPEVCIGSILEDCKDLQSFLSNNFMMALYMSLESGKFWFPAQVYEGRLVLDGLFSYNFRCDDFHARRRRGPCKTIDYHIRWKKLRPSPVEIPPSVRYVSECLEDLKPGDHIEIQCKERSNAHYDWLYAVIGHLESCIVNSYCSCRDSDWFYTVVDHLDSCNVNKGHCSCCDSETLVLQYIWLYGIHGERKRRVKLPRHKNEDRFFGGIRKLGSEEIVKWKEHFGLL